MTQALPSHSRRPFLMAMTFHSLLPPSRSSDEIVQRHANSGVDFRVTGAVDDLVRLDGDLAGQYSLVYEFLERTSPNAAAALDDLTSQCVENLQQHTVAASEAAPASAVGRAARVRRERIVESLTATLNDLRGLQRNGSTTEPVQVYSVLVSHLERTLGVTDTLPGDLERRSAGKWLNLDGLVPQEGDRTADLSASDSRLFAIARTGLEPLMPRMASVHPSFSADETPQAGAAGRSQFLA